MVQFSKLFHGFGPVVAKAPLTLIFNRNIQQFFFLSDDLK